jgi:hypothetical protein
VLEPAGMMVVSTAASVAKSWRFYVSQGLYFSLFTVKGDIDLFLDFSAHLYEKVLKFG